MRWAEEPIYGTKNPSARMIEMERTGMALFVISTGNMINPGLLHPHLTALPNVPFEGKWSRVSVGETVKRPSLTS